MKSMQKILVVDDDSAMRGILSDLLVSEGYQPFTASNGKLARKEISACSPDLILLDIRMPGMDGMTLLEKIKEIDSRIEIIMLTGHGDIKDAVRAIKLGAFDYITKPFNNDDIIAAIQSALKDSTINKSTPVPELSLREKEVLSWVKKGKNTWDISKILDVSTRTVTFHITNIMQKLNAVSRTQAVAVAIEKGIIEKE